MTQNKLKKNPTFFSFYLSWVSKLKSFPNVLSSKHVTEQHLLIRLNQVCGLYGLHIHVHICLTCDIWAKETQASLNVCKNGNSSLREKPKCKSAREETEKCNTQFTEKYGAEETHSERSVSDTQLF